MGIKIKVMPPGAAPENVRSALVGTVFEVDSQIGSSCFGIGDTSAKDGVRINAHQAHLAIARAGVETGDQVVMEWFRDRSRIGYQSGHYVIPLEYCEVVN